MVHGMEYHHTTPYHSETYVSQNFRTHMYIHMVQKRSHLDAIQPSANRTHVIQTMTPADGGSTNPEDPPVPSNEEKVVMESQQTASGRSAFNFKDWFEAAARKTLVRVETASTIPAVLGAAPCHARPGSLCWLTPLFSCRLPAPQVPSCRRRRCQEILHALLAIRGGMQCH